MHKRLVLGRYQGVRRIRSGGMAEVWLARDMHRDDDGRRVVLKVALPAMGQDATFEEALVEEGRVLSRLRHPHIVSLLAAGRYGNSWVLALEHVDGISLSELLVWRALLGGLPAPVVARVASSIAGALAHAHAAADELNRPLRLVHRDVSPDNIMIRSDGVAKLIDFGIASRERREARTAAGLVKGKLAYMSPEQTLGARVDARTDQFALGVVTWEALCGRRMFVSHDTPAQRARKLRAAASTLRDCAPECPEQLAEVVTRMLSLQPEERFANCDQVASALATYLRAEGEAGSTRSVAAAVIEPAACMCSEDVVDDLRAAAALEEEPRTSPERPSAISQGPTAHA